MSTAVSVYVPSRISSGSEFLLGCIYGKGTDVSKYIEALDCQLLIMQFLIWRSVNGGVLKHFLL